MIKTKTEQNVIFNNEDHQQFFSEYLPKCRYQDVYHAALVYCLGIDRDTRKHVDSIYDFKTGEIKTECLHQGWLTSGSAKVIRMAFNLYCNSIPSADDYEEPEEQLEECSQYAVEDLFCCEYAKYFWQAVRIRYPEYCL